MGDVGIGRSKIGEEGNEIAHACRRLAPREDGEKGKKKGKKEGKGAVHRLFLRRGGAGSIDQIPKLWVLREKFIFGKGQLGAEGEILEGVFVEDAVNDKPGLGFLEIDAVFAGAITVEGAVGPADDAKTVGMFFEKVGGEDVEFAEDLDLKRGRELGDFGRTCGGEDDLESGHVRRNLTGEGG